MCPLKNTLHFKNALKKRKNKKNTLISFLAYFYCGLGVIVTEQLQISVNILLLLIHDASCFINVTFSVLGMYKKEPSPHYVSIQVEIFISNMFHSRSE